LTRLTDHFSQFWLVAEHGNKGDTSAILTMIRVQVLSIRIELDD